MKERPKNIAETAYRWCVTAWKNHKDEGHVIITDYWDWRKNVCLCLEIGFRHIRYRWDSLFKITVAEHDRSLFEMDFGPDDGEAVTDLAWASFLIDESSEVGFSVCANFILKYHSRAAIPLDLWETFICIVEATGCRALQHVGKQRCVELLNLLRIGIQDRKTRRGLCENRHWAEVLLEIVQSTEGQHLAIQSWEFLAELAI